MSRSESLIRAAFSVLTLWVWLLLGPTAAQTLFGRQPTSAELGLVAVGVFLSSYLIASLVIRGVRSDDGTD